MRTRRGPVLVALAFCVCFSLFQSSAVAHPQLAGVPQSYHSPSQEIEDRAKVENLSDGNSVSALIDGVFEYPHFFGHIPPVMEAILEGRLAQAEIKYKFGRGSGVHETDIVQIVNMLADKFQLPEYARTTPHQVEVLRLGLELGMPVLMERLSPQKDGEPADVNSPIFSPVQATHILLMLIDQKVFNPDYQLPLDEWEKTQYEQTKERVLKYKELRDSGQLVTTQKRGAFTVGVNVNKDLRTPISRAVSQMGLTDGLDIVDQVFSLASIEK